MAEKIGGVSVAITGDMSDLKAAFSEAQTTAQQSGHEVASAFNSASTGTTEFTGALEKVSGAAQQAGIETSGLLKGLLEFAGIGIGIGALREFVGGALEMASSVEKSRIALGALTGDAVGANQRIEELKQTAMTFAVPFESLLTVQQRFSAFGISLDQSSAAMHAAIEAAAALNTSVEATAQSIDRLVLSGIAGNRQLMQLGLSTQDLADAMGVSADQVKKAFAAMDESERLTVIEEALKKFKGTAEAVADSFPGHWQQAKTQFNLILEEIGVGLQKSVSGWALALQWLQEHTPQYITSVNTAIRQLEDQAHAAGLQFAQLTAQFVAGTLAPKEYLDTLQKLIAAHKEHKTAVEDDGASTKKTSDNISVLKDALDEAKTKLAAMTAGYQSGKISAAEYSGAQAAVKSAQEAVNKALQQSDPILEALIGKHKTLSTATGETKNATDILASSLSASEGALSRVDAKLAAAKAALDAAAVSGKNMDAVVGSYTKALNESNTAHANFLKALDDAAPALGEANKAFEAAHVSLDNYTKSLDAGQTSFAHWIGQASAAKNASNDFGIQMLTTDDAVKQAAGGLNDAGVVTMSSFVPAEEQAKTASTELQQQLEAQAEQLYGLVQADLSIVSATDDLTVALQSQADAWDTLSNSASAAGASLGSYQMYTPEKGGWVVSQGPNGLVLTYQPSVAQARAQAEAAAVANAGSAANPSGSTSQEALLRQILAEAQATLQNVTANMQAGVSGVTAQQVLSAQQAVQTAEQNLSKFLIGSSSPATGAASTGTAGTVASGTTFAAGEIDEVLNGRLYTQLEDIIRLLGGSGTSGGVAQAVDAMTNATTGAVESAASVAASTAGTVTSAAAEMVMSTQSVAEAVTGVAGGLKTVVGELQTVIVALGKSITGAAAAPAGFAPNTVSSTTNPAGVSTVISMLTGVNVIQPNTTPLPTLSQYGNVTPYFAPPAAGGGQQTFSFNFSGASFGKTDMRSVMNDVTDAFTQKLRTAGARF